MGQELMKTPFYHFHVAKRAKMVNFNGFAMPVQYTSIIDEHQWVRNSCGVFDVSHMGKFHLLGDGVDQFLQWITPGNVKEVKRGRVVYSAILYEDGSPVDDVVLYKLGQEDWLIVVNAGNREKAKQYIFDQMKQFTGGKFAFVDVTDSHLQLAVQGPLAKDVVTQYVHKDLGNLDYYTFATIDFRGKKLIVSRTGYTGEDGFEIYGTYEKLEPLCEEFCADERVLPAGLGARDSLRLETRYPLYGHELRPGRTLVQSGLNWIVNYGRGDFLGRSTLQSQKEQGEKSRIHAFQMAEPGVPRDGYAILNADKDQIGTITSGGYSPSLQKGIILAYLDQPDQEGVYVQIRDQVKKIEKVSGTFVPNRTLKGKAGLS